MDQTLIDNLPSNGRRVDNFVLGTSPGVTNDGDFGLLSFRGIAMGNSFLTDGNDTTESFYNENAGRTRIGSQISGDFPSRNFRCSPTVSPLNSAAPWAA